MEIYSFETLESTQKYLLDQIKSEKLKTPVALYSKRQSAGIGSRDNSWTGAEGDLFLSFAVDIQELPRDLSLGSSSIYFAYLMKNILIQYDTKVWLKWPNDIYRDGDKIGGVITQKHKEILICGIGVNLHKNDTNDFKSLEIDATVKEVIERYLYTIEEFPRWKQIFSEYQIEFEQSKCFLVHIDNSKKSLKDAHLCEDGSLIIEGKRVYSLR